MDQQITIEEKYSGYWIQITIGIAILTVIFLVAYSMSSDILWEGIFRLIAFAGLAGTVMSALKVMQGKFTIHFEIENKNLSISYLKGDRTVGNDLFPLDDVGMLYTENHASFMGENLFFNDQNVRFIPVESDRPLYLVKVNGRPLALPVKDAEKVLRFVAAHAPNAEITEN